MKKRITALFIFFIIIFSVSCNNDKDKDNNTSNAETSQAEVLSVAKITSDSLNPLTVTTNTNQQLLKLCFDGLFKINSAFVPEAVIAKSYIAESNTYTFVINANAKFSDGTKVTASDVEYSYKLASSNALYSRRFAYIQSYGEKNGSFVVAFSTASDRNLDLLDIPVIKKGSEANTIPIGSGRYVLTEESGQYKMTANKSWVLGGSFAINEIKVIEVPDIDTLFHSFNSGQIKAAYSDLLNVTKTYLGTIDLDSFTTNNLFFLGINTGRAYFTSNKVRQGFSCAINRTKLVSEVLLTYGTPAWHPFNPAWSAVGSFDIPADIYSKETAASTLDEGGFTTMPDGKRGLNGASVNLVLLVCSDNSYKVSTAKSISEDLSKVGISVTVNSVSVEQYNNDLNSKNFDLFIGEVKIPLNMDISVLGSSAVNKGGWNAQTFTDILSQLDTKAIGIDGAVTKFYEECPVIPLYYKKSALVVTRSLTGNIVPSDSDIFYGLENCSLK